MLFQMFSLFGLNSLRRPTPSPAPYPRLSSYSPSHQTFPFTIFNPLTPSPPNSLTQYNPNFTVKPFLRPEDLVILSQISKTLTCDLCDNFFSHPVTTVCNHTFCFDCFNKCPDKDHTCPICTGQTLPLLSPAIVHKLARLIAKLEIPTPPKQQPSYTTYSPQFLPHNPSPHPHPYFFTPSLPLSYTSSAPSQSYHLMPFPTPSSSIPITNPTPQNPTTPSKHQVRTPQPGSSTPKK